MKPNFLLFIIILLFSNSVIAQTDILTSKYIFNPMYFNPANTGMKGEMDLTYSIASGLRFGMNRFPNKEILSLGIPIRSQRWSFGVNAKHESTLGTRDIMLKPTAVYRLGFNDGASILHIGTSASYTRRRFENLLVFPNISNQHINSANLGGGILYTGRLGYIGISVRDILNKQMNVVDNTGMVVPIFLEERKIDARGGLSIRSLSQVLTVRPSVGLTRMRSNLTFGGNDFQYNAEINLEIELYDAFNFGASYRDADILKNALFQSTYIDAWFGYKKYDKKLILITNWNIDEPIFRNRFTAELLFGYAFYVKEYPVMMRYHFF